MIRALDAYGALRANAPKLEKRFEACFTPRAPTTPAATIVIAKPILKQSTRDAPRVKQHRDDSRTGNQASREAGTETYPVVTLRLAKQRLMSLACARSCAS